MGYVIAADITEASEVTAAMSAALCLPKKGRFFRSGPGPIDDSQPGPGDVSHPGWVTRPGLWASHTDGRLAMSLDSSLLATYEHALHLLDEQSGQALGSALQSYTQTVSGFGAPVVDAPPSSWGTAVDMLLVDPAWAQKADCTSDLQGLINSANGRKRVRFPDVGAGVTYKVTSLNISGAMLEAEAPDTVTIQGINPAGNFAVIGGSGNIRLQNINVNANFLYDYAIRTQGATKCLFVDCLMVNGNNANWLIDLGGQVHLIRCRSSADATAAGATRFPGSVGFMIVDTNNAILQFCESSRSEIGLRAVGKESGLTRTDLSIPLGTAGDPLTSAGITWVYGGVYEPFPAIAPDPAIAMSAALRFDGCSGGAFDVYAEGALRGVRIDYESHNLMFARVRNATGTSGTYLAEVANGRNIVFDACRVPTGGDGFLLPAAYASRKIVVRDCVVDSKNSSADLSIVTF